MTRNKFILAGVLAGAMALGTACKSNDSAERGMSTEPTQTQPQNPTAPQDMPPAQPGTGGSEYGEPVSPPGAIPPDDHALPPEDGRGGSGYEDPMLFPEGEKSGTPVRPDIRNQDPSEDSGIGGSGYEGDDSLTRGEDQRLGGNKFPGDHNVPQ